YARRRANTRGWTTTWASAARPTRPTGAWHSASPTRTWSTAGPTAYSPWAAWPITIGLDFEAIRVDFVFHDLDGVAPRFGLRRPFHQRGIVHRGIPFGAQPNLLCTRNVHAHFNKFDCFRAASIDLRGEVQNRCRPGDVACQFAIVGFEFTEVVEGPKPHGRCRGGRWLRTV